MTDRYKLAACLAFILGMGVDAGCTAAQKAETKQVVACTAADADKVAKILAGPGDGYQKLLELAEKVEPDVAACLLRSAKPRAPAAT